MGDVSFRRQTTRRKRRQAIKPPAYIQRRNARSPAASASGYSVSGFAPLVAIFVVALFLRLVHVWQIDQSPFGPVLLGDSAGYDRWAREIVSGDWLGTEVFYQAPLYPYLLGILYSLVGADLTTVRVSQAILSAGSCVLFAAAGRRWFSARIGVAAGIGLALYAPAIFLDTTVQKSVVDLFLLSAVLWLMARTVDDSSRVDPSSCGAGTRSESWPWSASGLGSASWVGIGALLGALSLSRENALVLIGAVVAWLVIERGTPEERNERNNWKGRVTLVISGVAVVLLPVAARNGMVGGEWQLTTSQFGPNFYIGNHADADGAYHPLRYGRGDPKFERDDATTLAEESVGQELTPAGVSRYWFDQAAADIRAAPARWLRLLARKTALTVNAAEAIDTESQYAHADYSTPLAATGWIAHFGVLLPFAAVGVLTTWSARRRLRPLYLMSGLYAVSIIAFYVFARYRYPLVPFLVLFAAAGGDYVVGIIRGTVTPARPRLLLAVVVVTALAANWPLSLLSRESMKAVTYNNLATAYRERGDLTTAMVWYDIAVDADPQFAQAHSNLASVHAAVGSFDDALRHYEHAVAQDPSAGGIRFNYGNLLMASERYADAVEQYRQAVRVWPMDAEAHNNLGISLGSLGRNVEAAGSFREAVRINPDDAFAHRNLGIVLSELGDLADAVAHRDEARRLETRQREETR